MLGIIIHYIMKIIRSINMKEALRFMQAGVYYTWIVDKSCKLCSGTGYITNKTGDGEVYCCFCVEKDNE